MSSSTSSFSPAKIAIAVASTLAAGSVAYAVYFDYKRRNDPVFRKKLLREHKKVQKSSKQQEEVGRATVVAALKRALQLVNSEPVPQDVEGKEQFFMEQVAMGEQLAARSPEFYVASAISFYKALKVYPAPQELIMIYQKTQPPAVFDLVMELISLEMAGLSSSDPRDATSSDPLLQEIDDEVPSSAPSTAPSSAAPASVVSDNGSGSSSFVVVEEETVEVKVGATPTEEVKGEDPPEPTL